ncbi:hypothetical protein [Listeria welshimeri]|nr:hypothetical protein [Listeria welshimeri]
MKKIITFLIIGVLGTSAKHGYVVRITRVSIPFGSQYIVSGVWRQ